MERDTIFWQEHFPCSALPWILFIMINLLLFTPYFKRNITLCYDQLVAVYNISWKKHCPCSLEIDQGSISEYVIFSFIRPTNWLIFTVPLKVNHQACFYGMHLPNFCFCILTVVCIQGLFTPAKAHFLQRSDK